MPQLPQIAELKRMIEVAMKDRAPAMHSELKAKGQLKTALHDRAEMATDSYLQAINEQTWAAAQESRQLTPQATVQELTEGQTRAAQVAIAQAVDFEPSPPEEQTT